MAGPSTIRRPPLDRAKGFRAWLPRMNPERWKRVDELYHAARDRPMGERPSFLAEACRDDAALRREVESLLEESVSEDGFLAGPALVAAAQVAADLAREVFNDVYGNMRTETPLKDLVK